MAPYSSPCFLHVSTPGDFGTFVANSAGYANGDSATFTTPIAGATCAQAASYAANTTAISTPTPTPENGACAVNSVPSVAAPSGAAACTAAGLEHDPPSPRCRNGPCCC